MKRKQLTKAAYRRGRCLVYLLRLSPLSSFSDLSAIEQVETGEIPEKFKRLQHRVFPRATVKVQSVESMGEHSPATVGKGNYVFTNISPVFDDIIVERFLSETNTKGLKPIIEQVKSLGSPTQPAVSTI